MQSLDRSCVPHPLLETAHEIIQQIKTVSQRSAITHKWTPQLEKDCTRFFSPGNIERFIRIYWIAWHPHYPVIHKPTFCMADTPVHLTAAMCIIGACFSPNENDRITAKPWLNSVEEIVFTNPYFGDIILHDEATVNVREIVQLLQAAYCVSTFQISEGSKVSRRRIRRQRFNMVVSVSFSDLNFATMLTAVFYSVGKRPEPLQHNASESRQSTRKQLLLGQFHCKRRVHPVTSTPPPSYI